MMLSESLISESQNYIHSHEVFLLHKKSLCNVMKQK